jgi:hypothetical protein
MKTAERRDEYLEFAYMGIPMAFSILEKEPGKFVPALAVWADEKDDGAKIAFDIVSKRIPKEIYPSVSAARDSVNEIVVRDHRIIIGTWKRGEVASKVKCANCRKEIDRRETACVRDRTSLVFVCLDQCVQTSGKELF